MPMMVGFSEQRRQMLRAEVARFGREAPALGALRAWLVGDLARNRVEPASELELILVQETEEPFRRRADFWASHLRPRVATRFLVYTPGEVGALEEIDPLLREARLFGEIVIG